MPWCSHTAVLAHRLDATLSEVFPNVSCDSVITGWLHSGSRLVMVQHSAVPAPALPSRRGRSLRPARARRGGAVWGPQPRALPPRPCNRRGRGLAYRPRRLADGNHAPSSPPATGSPPVPGARPAALGPHLFCLAENCRRLRFSASGGRSWERRGRSAWVQATAFFSNFFLGFQPRF